MTLITNETLNNNTNYHNIFILLKKNMVNGELKIYNLSSKNRSLLHRVCAFYNLEHYSTGNYSDRIIVIKDSNHSYFDSQFTIYSKTCNDISNKTKTYDDECEEDYEEDYEDEEDDEEIEEEADTDTYSSSSESSSGSVQSDYSTYSQLKNEFTSIKILSKINLVLNIFIIYNISLR